MIGLGQLSSFEECINFLKENPGFNGIIHIKLFCAPSKIYKEYFACDRFESFFDGIMSYFDIDTIKEIFKEPFTEIEVSYRLMPRGKRTEPFCVSSRNSKDQIINVKNLNVEIELKIFEVLYKEMLYALVEGK